MRWVKRVAIPPEVPTAVKQPSAIVLSQTENDSFQYFDDKMISYLYAENGDSHVIFHWLYYESATDTAENPISIQSEMCVVFFFS